MKKLIAMFLVLVMAAALCGVAYGDSEEEHPTYEDVMALVAEGKEEEAIEELKQLEGYEDLVRLVLKAENIEVEASPEPTPEPSGLTTDMCVGTWVLESGAGLPLNMTTDADKVMCCSKLVIIKGGIAQGYEEINGNSYVQLQWEISDDTLKVWWDMFGLGYTGIFEIDNDTMTAVDGSNYVYIRQLDN